jgi:hypothetical protein
MEACVPIVWNRLSLGSGLSLSMPALSHLAYHSLVGD